MAKLGSHKHENVSVAKTRILQYVLNYPYNFNYPKSSYLKQQYEF